MCRKIVLLNTILAVLLISIISCHKEISEIENYEVELRCFGLNKQAKLESIRERFFTDEECIFKLTDGFKSDILNKSLPNTVKEETFQLIQPYPFVVGTLLSRAISHIAYEEGAIPSFLNEKVRKDCEKLIEECKVVLETLKGFKDHFEDCFMTEYREEIDGVREWMASSFEDGYRNVFEYPEAVRDYYGIYFSTIKLKDIVQDIGGEDYVSFKEFKDLSPKHQKLWLEKYGRIANVFYRICRKKIKEKKVQESKENWIPRITEEPPSYNFYFHNVSKE